MLMLPNFTSRRNPLFKALLGIVVLVLASLVFGAIPTQWWAAKYNYDWHLGRPLFTVLGVSVYQPLKWVTWGFAYADSASLQKNVHNLFMIGGCTQVIALLFTGYIALRMSRHTPGMDGLHGTAHFAEFVDVDQTGFVDAPGHKATGVVVGSIMLDSKGRVIHPHHPKFHQRYEPIYEPWSWRRPFTRIPKREPGNRRPKFQVRKSVVRETQWLRDGGNTHLFGFCPTRSGKGTGMVIPTLLTWQHSVTVNDPKGEAFALTAGFRKAAGQDVIKFEPACTDGTSARWNPLDEIRIFTLHDVADSQMIMTMACDPKGKGLDDYFDKAGYEFLTAVALHVRYTSSEGSLAACAHFLGDPAWDSDKQMYSEMISAVHDPDGKMGWKDSMGRPSRTHPMIANAAATMLKKEDKDRSGVLSTAKSLLSLYLDPIVANNTSTSDFLVRDLMTGERPVSLYYVVPSDDMERLTPLTRLFYAIFIRRNASEMVFENGRGKGNYTHQMLMIIDEAASLQKLPILQEALGYVAGYGIRMFFLVQDIVQIEELYGDKQSFDSGAETRIAYAPNKIETAEKLARMTGKTTVTEESGSVSRDIFGIKLGNVSVGTNKTARDLVTADEFMSLHDQDLVLFVKGHPPIYGRKAFFYENPVLVQRSSIPPPKTSPRLKSATSPLQEGPNIASSSQEDEMSDEQRTWMSGRAAMRERLASSASLASAVGQSSITSNASTLGQPSTPIVVQKSRYAEVVRVLTPEDRAQIDALVQSAGVVDNVINIAAF